MHEAIPRRSFVAGVTVALAGCGGEGGDASTATGTTSGETERQGSLRLASPAFEDGAAIPEKYGRDAQNVNPPLSITGVPSGTQSLTLIMDDPDAVEPAGKVWLHWLVWNIPPSTTAIPEGWEPTTATEGTNDFGTRGYGGPAPPDSPHTYRFRLYALDTTLDLPDSAGKETVLDATTGHRLAMARLEGTYAP